MNKQFENYFLQALYDAKLKQITQTYQEKGFSCKTQVKIDEIQFDVIAKNRVFMPSFYRELVGSFWKNSILIKRGKCLL